MVYLWFITALCSIGLTYFLINKAKKQFSWAYVAWIIAFMLFTFSSLGSWLSYLTGWTPLLYKTWYFSAALLVAIMGLGQILLLKWHKTSIVLAVYTAIISAMMLVAIIPATVDSQIIAQSGEIGGTGLPSDVRMFSPLLTIPGSLALIGGALYSAIRFRSKPALFILVGAIILASGGTFVRMDVHFILPIANLIGIVLIFVGSNITLLKNQLVQQKRAEIA